MSTRAGIAACLCLFALSGSGETGVRVVGDWPADLGGPWRQREFAGATDYRTDPENPAVIVAYADGTASALYREIEIDLRETPYLQWSWRVDRLPDIDAPETERAGDDYGARIYVVKEGFFGKLSTRALNYVWSQRQAEGERWPNAFTDRAILWSVQQGPERIGNWLTYTRDIRADWHTAFGTDIESLDGIALMTDADNSGSRSAAHYGRIRFCSDRRCNRD